MAGETDLPNRHSIRLPDYDYSQGGGYFITICTQNRLCLLGHIEDGQLVLGAAGHMIKDIWDRLPERFPELVLDAAVVMPNHIHGILILTQDGRSQGLFRPQAPGAPHGTLPGTIGRIAQAFKSLTTHEYVRGVKEEGWTPFDGKLWQRNYYDRIIRNRTELNAVRRYIQENPAHWLDDTENHD